MKKSVILWNLWIIGVSVPFVVSLSCSESGACFCYQNSVIYEFQCPLGGEEYTISVTPEQNVKVECSRAVSKYNTTNMPNINVGDLEQFNLRFCPLPDTNFQETMEKFNITAIKDMYILGDYNKDVVYNITPEFFEGLSMLEKVTVNLGRAHFEANCLNKLPNLIRLDLATNKIAHLEGSMFGYTPKLRFLDLSRNFIAHLSDRIFENMSDLRVLHLWDNELSAISNKTFAGLNQLRSLELSINNISYLDEDAFSELGALANISLRKNNLNTISSRTFRNNGALYSVRLGRNPNLNLSDYVFANLLQLTDVNIDSSRLESLPEHLFEGSINLKVISLSDNNIKSLPEDLFKNLSNLTRLNLSRNNIHSLPNGIFNSLRQLVQLNLEYNNLTDINEKLFRNVINLRTLNLNNNKINVISVQAFIKLTGLIDLDLSHNLYNISYGDNVVGLHPFGSSEKLQKLKLSHNLIKQFPSGIVESLVNLKELHLEYNNIGFIAVTSLIAVSNRVTINLEYNNISIVNFQEMETTARANMPYRDALHTNYSNTVVQISHNPIRCDCNNFHFIQYNNDKLNPAIRTMVDINVDELYCGSPSTFTHILVQDLKPENIKCPLGDIGCPRECFCELRPADKCAIVNCTGRNLTEPPIIRLASKALTRITSDLDLSPKGLQNIEVHLEDNALEISPYAGMGYENVTRLFLTNNRIKNFTWVPPKIKRLALNGNRLTYIDSDIIRVLNRSTLENLTLSGNPWSCGCSSASLQNYLRNHYTKVHPYEVVCEDNKYLIDKKELCKTYTAIAMAIAIPILVFICAVAIISALYFYYQEQIKVWLYAKNLCLWFVTEEELDKDKTYDIFISYSHKDEEFVIQNLLPVLETGPNPFKICIHVRDWVPGEFIATQVTRSVLDSRRTLVVLSESFLESVWGKMEFRTAHTQAINEGRARVVVIKYGKLNEEKLDDELKTYLKTNTYVEWGDPWFWNKLKYALPHTRDNKFYNNNQKHANIMLKIDDKFELTSSPSIHVESTPPVMSLDPSLLKSHPLNFSSANNIATPPAEAPLMVKK